MNTIKLLLILICVVYGGLNILAGILQLKQKKINFVPSLLMIVGGLLIAIPIIIPYRLKYYVLFAIVIGLLVIHVATIYNGVKMYGKIHIKHHIIRLLISLSIILIYIKL